MLLRPLAEHPEAVLDTEGELNGTDPVKSARRIAEFTLSHCDTDPALTQFASTGNAAPITLCTCTASSAA